MENNNRPQGREKHVTGQGKDVYRRGEGLGTGPVGGQSQNGRGQAGGSARRSSGGASATRAGGGSKLLIVVILAVLLFGGGGLGLSGLFGGSSGETVSSGTQSGYTQQQSSGTAGTQGASPGGMSASLSSLLGGFGNVSTGWSGVDNTGRLDATVASGAREKYTNILGNGRDTVTLMVYMCGTDLESKYGMGTADLQEMMAATLSDRVNILVYTGGCKQWKNNMVSSTVNQIYKVERGRLTPLKENMGTAAMTSPANLTEFINYCKDNYPANRSALIFWDHGGGSLSGYGYDEKNPSAGSMSLAGINTALKGANMKFDFIGFDACLMATLENALMLSDYADYLIASEETEPGVGWYYTDWLTKLSANTSMPTLEIGKNIVDDFVRVCNEKCSGQSTTLSVVDLAELEATAPETLKRFAADTSEMIQGDEYKTVSSARSGTREFASSSKIDQVDLVDLAYRLDTDESRALADALLGAVKYNRTSSAMTNAYGLSIYFPYQKTSKVDSAVSTYDAIGLDDEYSRCIQQFASLEAGGQTLAGYNSGTASPLGSLLGTAMYSLGDQDYMSSLLSGLFSSASGRSLDAESATEYLTENYFDATMLNWAENTAFQYGDQWAADGYVIALSEEQWGLVNDLELNVFLDDGEGFIDLGLDNVFEFTDDGALRGEFDGTWLAIDGQPVPYYHTGTASEGDNYTITGYVPCLVNGVRAELLLVFDTANPYGYVAGYRDVYDETLTETVAKSAGTLAEGDVIDFVCDYYGYDGTYRDSYMLGAPCVWAGDAEISNVTLPDPSAANATYRFTDIYGQRYWTPPVP